MWSCKCASVSTFTAQCASNLNGTDTIACAIHKGLRVLDSDLIGKMEWKRPCRLLIFKQMLV